MITHSPFIELVSFYRRFYPDNWKELFVRELKNRPLYPQSRGKGNRARRRQGEKVMTPWEESLTLWTTPDSYSGAPWRDHFVFLARNRDSDYLDESNFVCGLAAIGGESDTVHVVREGHWACGWIEWIAIYKSDFKALLKASEIADSLTDYPILDESDHSEREMQEADQVWSYCYDNNERVAYIRDNLSQFDFRDFEDLLACARGKYFAGYASELLY